MSNGAGEKFGQFLNASGMIVGGLAIAYVRGWKLALILNCYFPVFLFLVFGVRKAVAGATVEKFK